jgi:hypothetical protein
MSRFGIKSAIIFKYVRYVLLLVDARVSLRISVVESVCARI